jgi:hypothetical protein
MSMTSTKQQAKSAKPRRTLGDLTGYELLSSALDDALAMGERLDRTEGLSDDDRLVLSAYIGSVLARISVARDKYGA